MSDNLAVAERITRLEADPAIAMGSVDLTIVDPDRLRLEFDEIFHYFALVEGEVAQNAVDIGSLLPDLDDHDLRFLAIWSAHEAAHSAIFDALRAELDLMPSAPTTPPRPRASFRTIGLLARVPWLHDVLKLMYLARGAMHEHMTYDAYVHLGARLSALGERALARTVTDPIRRQEARHLGYYRTAAAAHRRRLSPTQLRWARAISILTYTPVGAARRRSQCGRVFTCLAGDDFEQVLQRVEVVAQALLGDELDPLPPFVHRAMARCLGEGS